MQAQVQISSKVDVRDWSLRRINNARAGIVDPSPTPVGIYFRKSEIGLGFDIKVSKGEQATFAVVNRAMGIAGWGYVSSSEKVDMQSLCIYEKGADMRQFIGWLEEQDFVLIVESTSNKIRAFGSQSPFNSYTEYQIMRQCLTYLALTAIPELIPDLGLDRLSSDEGKELLSYLEEEQVVAYLPQFFLLFLGGDGESKIQRKYTAPKIEVAVPQPNFQGKPLDFQVPAPPRGLITQPQNPLPEEKSSITPSTIVDDLRKHLPDSKLWEKLPPRFSHERQIAKQSLVNIHLDGYAWKMLEWEKAWLQRAGIGTPTLLSPSRLGEVIRIIKTLSISGESFLTWSRELIKKFTAYEGGSLIRYGSKHYSNTIAGRAVIDAIEKAVIINGYASTQNYDDREYGNIFIPISLNARARLTSLKEEHRSDLEVLLAWSRVHDPEKVPHIRDLLYDRPVRDVFGHSQCATPQQCQQEPDDPACEMYAALTTLDLS